MAEERPQFDPNVKIVRSYGHDVPANLSRDQHTAFLATRIRCEKHSSYEISCNDCRRVLDQAHKQSQKECEGI